jgi:cation-transporting ATPase E
MEPVIVEQHNVGLDDAEVSARLASGQINITPEPPGRSFGQIVAANVFTVVNAIMLTLFVLVLVSGNPQDGLFVGVVISNSVIGVVQEVRARRELQRLAVVTEPRAIVVRNGALVEIASEDIVLDDVIELRLGGQVAVDGVVLHSTGLRLDESMLTGESLPVHKAVGEQVLSGSFVVAGNGRIRAVAVGADSYASTLATEAKQFATAQSQLRRGIDRILRWLTVIIPVDEPVVHGRHRRAGTAQCSGQTTLDGRGARSRRRALPRQDRHDHHRQHHLRGDPPH